MAAEIRLSSMRGPGYKQYVDFFKDRRGMKMVISCRLKIIHKGCALGICSASCFKEVRFDHIGIGV